jgi:hypothetical protein
MANLYVRSTDGSDADNGSTWALAKATLAGAFAAASAGDTIWVSQSHAETQASAMTLTSPGTAASPCRVLCGNDAAEPPTALATTATITTTGANSISLFGFAYYYGITFSSASGAVNQNINIGTNSTPWWMKFEACALQLAGTGASGRINVQFAAAGNDDQLLELVNTTVQFAHAGQSISVVGQLRWTGTASAVTGATLPTTLFTLGTAHGTWVELNGVDLSALGSGKNLFSVAGAAPHRVWITNCKLGSSVSATTGSIPGQGGTQLRLINSDSGDTNYRFQKSNYQGDIYSETTIVRSSGASDGTTPLSYKMVSSANSKFYSPLESEPIYYWNETTGSSVTVTVEVVTDNVTLKDSEAWVEVEYLGTSGFPLSSVASDRATDVLASGANQTSSSESWTTTGLGTPVKQKLAVSFTPQEKGLLAIRVMLAKASTTMYYDPKADIS